MSTNILLSPAHTKSAIRFPLARTAEIIVVHGARAITKLLAAAHASRRIQAARVIGHYGYLIDSTENAQPANSGRAQ